MEAMGGIRYVLTLAVEGYPSSAQSTSRCPLLSTPKHKVPIKYLGDDKDLSESLVNIIPEGYTHGKRESFS